MYTWYRNASRLRIWLRAKTCFACQVCLLLKVERLVVDQQEALDELSILASLLFAKGLDSVHRQQG